MSMFPVYCAVLALSGLCWAERSTPDRPPACEEMHPLSDKESFDPYARLAPFITRYFQNRTAIGVEWSMKAEDVQYANELCGFTVHYLQERFPELHWDIEIKHPNETRHLFTDLKPGTKYSYYVTAYYTTQHEPRSWKLTTYTDGCGPDDEGTFCDAKGSERCDEKTGTCICKTKQTTGDKCDICPTGFYMHSLGCTTCDHCPNDNFRSNGTCRPAKEPEGTMTCDCFFPFTGKHCRDCAPGYYWDDDECSPCSCPPIDDNEAGPSPSCDPLTGQCVCPKDRTGHNCEMCAEGYLGNPLNDKCVHHRNAGVTALIVIVVLIIGAVASVTTYMICRRRIAERMRKGFFRAHLREDYDKVNFTTLEEEPEFEPGPVKSLNSA